MTVPTEEIAGCRVAHDRTSTILGTITPEIVARASSLPEWTVGNVLAHLVGHGESVVRRLEAAASGGEVEQYPGGMAARDGFITEFGAAPVDEIAARLRGVNAQIDELFDTVDPDVWDVAVLNRDGARILAGELPFQRWREVEVHLVDLGIGHTPSDWPDTLVERWMPSLLSSLVGRAEPKSLMAWLLGRAPAPELGPWG